MARVCIAASGHYFGAVDDAGILGAGARGRGRGRARRGRAGDGACRCAAPTASRWSTGTTGWRPPPWPGEARVPARVRRGSVTTPLQDHLDRMSWIGGKRELYQPVDSPELEQSWPTVRRCDDRLELMDKQLADLGIVPDGSTYLDVASAYGWFVSRMTQRGFTATGIERDPEAGGARAGRVRAPARAGGHRRRRSTSCTTTRAPGTSCPASACCTTSCWAAARSTRRPCSGCSTAPPAGSCSSTPAWRTRPGSATRCPSGTPPTCASSSSRVGTFDRVVDLGPDHDAVAPYADNYGRHLFACIRDA